MQHDDVQVPTAGRERERETRILVLYPGSREDPLRVSLETMSLSGEGEAPTSSFEALSYAWGSQENPFELSLVAYRSGITRRVMRRLALALAPQDFDKHLWKPSGTVAITQNLATALPYLRLEDRVRLLWVDAICINQQDLKERSSQVKLMASIYGQAELVIAWLGVERLDSHIAFHYLTWLGTKIVVDWATMEVSSTSREYSWVADMEEELGLSDAEWDALDHTFNQPWFRRLWIRQEFTWHARHC